MSRHDEDGDLAGLTPNDNLGDVHASVTEKAQELLTKLRPDHETAVTIRSLIEEIEQIKSEYQSSRAKSMKQLLDCKAQLSDVADERDKAVAQMKKWIGVAFDSLPPEDLNSRSHFAEALRLGFAFDEANRRLQALGQPIVEGP